MHRLAFSPAIDILKLEREIWSECEIICNEERLLVEFSDNRGPGGGRRMAGIVFDWTNGHILLVCIFSHIHMIS